MPKGVISNGNKPFDGSEGNTFSKDNQPSNESKRLGHLKKKLLKDISESLLAGDDVDMHKSVASLFGVDVKELDYETLADLKQLEKAIMEGDTSAYNAFKDRLRGKAVQKNVNVELNKEPIPARKWRRPKDD